MIDNPKTFKYLAFYLKKGYLFLLRVEKKSQQIKKKKSIDYIAGLLLWSCLRTKSAINCKVIVLFAKNHIQVYKVL